MQEQRGFTLYELLLTLLLAALLAGLAIPSFSASLARGRQAAEVDALFHAVHRARKESVMRRKVVSVCPSLNGQQCHSSKDWSSGWLLFENRDRDSPPRVDPGEPVLQRHIADGAVQISANRRGFTLRATFLRATNGTLVFCDPQRRIEPKALIISYTGRPRVARHKSNRELYTCAD